MINLRKLMDTETELYTIAESIRGIAEYGVALSDAERDSMRVSEAWFKAVAERISQQFATQLAELDPTRAPLTPAEIFTGVKPKGDKS